MMAMGAQGQTSGSDDFDDIIMPIAVLWALDKITAKITVLEIPIGQSRRFGSLQITPRRCLLHPPTAPPEAKAYIEIAELNHRGKKAALLSHWIFASSPGISGLQHPVYDIWLRDCKSAAVEKSAPAE